jgi:hypothetical protein
MLAVANGAVYFHETTAQGAANGSRTALLTCRPKDIDLGADDLIALGSAMVRAGRRIKDAE